MYRAFSAIGETRTLTKAGYARFRDFLLYGERGLAGYKVLINIFQDILALEYGEHPLAKYSVEWQPDEKGLRRVGNPRLYDHPYQSPQLQLWSPSEVEWFVIIQVNSYGSRPRRKRSVLLFFSSFCSLMAHKDKMWPGRGHTIERAKQTLSDEFASQAVSSSA